MSRLRVFYHLTAASFEASIRSCGLQPTVEEILADDGDETPGVNLAATQEPNYREPLPGVDMWCIITLDEADPLLMSLDSWWWRYNGRIPPDAIQFVQVV